MTSVRPPRLVMLDGLRGLAALVVVVYHVQFVRGQIFPPFSGGFLAVDLFFILSGFVLTLAFEGKMRTGLYPVHFLWSRIKRLWPALIVGGLLATFWMADASSWTNALKSLAGLLLMVPATQAEASLFPMNVPQWTIAFELLANVAHALLLCRLSSKWLSGLCAIFAMILLWQIGFAGTVDVGGSVDNAHLGVARTFFPYILGILFARHWKGEPQTVSPFWWVALVAPIIVILGVGFFRSIDGGLGEGLAVFIAFPLLFWALISVKPPLWVTGWLQWLGAISYPIYAIHEPILLDAAAVNRLYVPSIQNGYVMIVAFVAAVACAHGMAHIGRWYGQWKKASRRRIAEKQS